MSAPSDRPAPPSLRLVPKSFLGLFLAAPGLAAQLPPVPTPINNPTTTPKVTLGGALFWDEQLSSTNTTSCGTCHIPTAGGSDPRSFGGSTLNPGFDGVFGTPDDVVGSPGVIGNQGDSTYVPTPPFGLRVQVTGRKAPSMINAAFANELFWDGRAPSTFTDPVTGQVVLFANAALESQAAAPPLNTIEMGHFGRDWLDVAARIQGCDPLALSPAIPASIADAIDGRSYPELFVDAFGSPAVTPARVIQALASYERTLISDQTPFDAFQAGDPTALTPLELQGLQVFNDPQNRCSTCHSGPLFTDQGFHDVGVRPDIEDLGRFDVTGAPPDRGRFKTPSLRNVGLRAPYFHNGGMATLEEVVDFYDRGGDFPADPLIQPLGLSPQERTALVAFLRNALTDPRVENETGPFTRPLLFTEGPAVPSPFGFPTAGTLGIPPRAIAIEPPLLGNDSLTLAMADGLGGAAAFLGIDLAPSAGTPVGGATAFLAGTNALLTVPTILDAVGPGQGHASLVFAVPDNASLAGTALHGQWFVADPGGPVGLSATAAFTMTLF